MYRLFDVLYTAFIVVVEEIHVMERLPVSAFGRMIPKLEPRCVCVCGDCVCCMCGVCVGWYMGTHYCTDVTSLPHSPFHLPWFHSVTSQPKSSEPSKT